MTASNRVNHLRAVLDQQDDPIRFLDLMSMAFGKDSAGDKLSIMSDYLSPIKYFGQSILPPRLTTADREEMQTYRNAAIVKVHQSKKAPETTSRGKEPRLSQSTSTLAKEALIGLTTDTAKKIAVAAPSSKSQHKTSGPLPNRINLPRNPQTYMGVEPPSSPQHRTPVYSEEHVKSESIIDAPPHEIYPPIQIVVKPTPDIVVEDRTKRSPQRRLHPGSRSPRRDFNAGRGAIVTSSPESVERRRHVHSSRRPVKPSVLIQLSALVKGHMVRMLMRTQKAKDLIQTIRDTNRLVSEFNNETSSKLSTNDREFLRRAHTQLKRAKDQLANMVVNSTAEERVKLLQRQRAVEEEKAFRSTGSARPKTTDGSSGYLSDTTRRLIKRKQEEAARPFTAPIRNRGSTPAKSATPASPKHTDFLRKKTGTSAGGKHSDAPIVSPSNAKHASSPMSTKKLGAQTPTRGDKTGSTSNTPIKPNTPTHSGQYKNDSRIPQLVLRA